MHTGTAHDVNSHGDAAFAFCFSASGPVDQGRLADAISALQTEFGADLLRMKGLVATSDHPSSPCVLHVTGHVASPLRRLESWPEGVEATRIVMIVGGPDRSAAPELLMRFLPELRGLVSTP